MSFLSVTVTHAKFANFLFQLEGFNHPQAFKRLLVQAEDFHRQVLAVDNGLLVY